MQLSDVMKFLAICSQFDGRKADETVAGSWLQVIDLYVPDMTYAEAEVAVLAHYGDKGDWLMPNVLIERVRQRRVVTANGKLLGIGGPKHPKSDMGYQVVVRTLAEIRATGGGDPLHGKVIGKERCIEIAERVIEEMGVKKGLERPGKHCGWALCNCTHTDGCDAGWIELADGTAVEACQFCAPTRHHILASALSTDAAGGPLRDPLRNSR